MLKEEKKKIIKDVLALIEKTALGLVDEGSTSHPMDILTELMITAYEADLLLEMAAKAKQRNSNTTTTSITNNVFELKPKKEEMN
jgi:hypothetical protein